MVIDHVAATADDIMPCPNCARWIEHEASTCPHCNLDIDAYWDRFEAAEARLDAQWEEFTSCDYSDE